jgi:hypothetical protein
MCGTITNDIKSESDLTTLYRANLLDFGFEMRLREMYNIGLLKEKECTIKIIDFIFANIQNRKLFLTQDHPTTFVFAEVTRQICNKLNIQFDIARACAAEENLSALEDSVYSNTSTCQYPISRYAIKYFGFHYVASENDDADDFYLSNVIDYYRRFYKK